MNPVVVDTDVVSYLFKSHPIAFQYLTDRTPIASFPVPVRIGAWDHKPDIVKATPC